LQLKPYVSFRVDVQKYVTPNKIGVEIYSNRMICLAEDEYPQPECTPRLLYDLHYAEKVDNARKQGKYKDEKYTVFKDD